jgi:CRP/FNR family transcriptional regulator
MTREEIGSYLGMKLETVSRLFSKFQANGLIAVDQKYVHLRNIEGLREIYATTHDSSGRVVKYSG